MKTLETERVEAIVNAIKPLLAGQGAEIQGAVLADLLATWLAGHIVPGNPASTDKIRDDLLEHHIGTVRELVPINAAEMYGGGVH